MRFVLFAEYSCVLTEASLEVKVPSSSQIDAPSGDRVSVVQRTHQLKMNSKLYQKGVADNLILNHSSNGNTSENKFDLKLEEPLNFSDSTIKLAKGWITLKSHNVTGPVKMTLIYSISGLDTRSVIERMPAVSPELQEQERPQTEEEEEEGAAETLMTEEEEIEELERRAIKRPREDNVLGDLNPVVEEIPEKRAKRVHVRPLAIFVGNLPRRQQLHNWCSRINYELNKP